MHSNLCDPAGRGPLRTVPAERTVPLWSVIARLPLPPGRSTQPGVAGPFAGVSGDALIVAGGSNFPDKKPWEGGRKAYVDEVYVLMARTDGVGGDGAGA
ncbi:MAG TPA: hypothetical protein VGS79_05230, partial [Puia sp.]|nr:hypothetical protein [Puia sp.]